MKKKYIFKLNPHKNQISMFCVSLFLGLFVLLIGLISLVGGNSKTFDLSLSGFAIFFIISMIFLDKLEFYEIYEHVIVVKNGFSEVNRVYIKDVKFVKIKELSTNVKYAQSHKVRSFVFCDGRNEINNTISQPGNFDYFLNNSKCCVRIYFNEKLEQYIKSKGIKII